MATAAEWYARIRDELDKFWIGSKEKHPEKRHSRMIEGLMQTTKTCETAAQDLDQQREAARLAEKDAAKAAKGKEPEKK